MMDSMRLTRLAPSPTGALHLGNARTFLVNWLMARRAGWRIILRIEDLDGPRIKPGADRQAVEDLQWLGLDWDEGPVHQSGRLPAHRTAIDLLLRAGAAYPCICSRKDIESAASAPHAGDGSSIYPGTCRGRYASVEAARQQSGRPAAVRLRMPDELIRFTDQFKGPRCDDAAGQLGDFVIAKADRTPAYQLAVVVDDAAMNITDVVRGDDLLESAPRQIVLYQALGMAGRIPRYWHLPLVIGPDGRRLAKRHGDSRLAFYRHQGVPAGRVLRLLARWCGIEPAANVRRASDLLDSFTLERLAKTPITFTPADHRFLLDGAPH